MGGFDFWKLTVGGMTKDSDVQKNGEVKRWRYVFFMLGVFVLLVLGWYVLSLIVTSS
jgi:hypothetical protein